MSSQLLSSILWPPLVEGFQGGKSWVKHFHVMLGKHTNSTVTVSESFSIKSRKLTNKCLKEGRFTSSILTNKPYTIAISQFIGDIFKKVFALKRNRKIMMVRRNSLKVKGKSRNRTRTRPCYQLVLFLINTKIEICREVL